jgi:hypothetical protein
MRQVLTDTEGVVPENRAAKGFENLILDINGTTAITIPLLHMASSIVHK